jgi:hypothetical protein
MATPGVTIFDDFSLETAAAGTVTAAPTSLTATAASSTQINLSWTDLGNDFEAENGTLTSAMVAVNDSLASNGQSVTSSTSFEIDVNITDGQSHQVAVYCLDWDAI